MTASAAPVGDAERIQSLDFTRGAAVLGILLMNIWAFAGPQAAFDYPRAVADLGGAPVATWFVIHTLFEGSQRGLFSLLFGAGMLLLVGHLEAGGPAVRPARVYYRRVGLLILIGLIDAFALLWPADILVTYGTCGLLLYPFRRLGAPALVGMALLVMTVNAGVRVADLAEAREGARAAQAVRSLGPGVTVPPEIEASAAKWEKSLARARPDLRRPEARASLQATAAGSLAELWKERARTSLILQTVVALNAWVLDSLAVMFLGMAALRAGLLTRPVATRTLAWLVIAGYGVGLPLSLAETYALLGSDFDPLVHRRFLLVYDARRLGMAAGHLGVLLWYFQRPGGAWLKARLAAVGRMALSNYLGQSLVCGLVFYSVGLGLYGRYTGWHLYVVVALVWALLLAWSPWCLARYRFGPAEWAWRSLTYGRVQPFRRG
jgi:uncharacterized protein